MTDRGKQMIALGRLLVASVLFSTVYPPLWKVSYSRQSVADGLTIAGLLLLTVGLFRLVRWLGLFDSTLFGWKTFLATIQAKSDLHGTLKRSSLAEYKQTHPYQKKYLPFLAAAALDLVAAALL